MKKCLLVSTIHSSLVKPVRDAFRRAGFDVRFIDYRGHPFLAHDNMIRYVLAKLPTSIRNHANRYALDQINRRTINIAREYHPDIIFTIKAKELTADTLGVLNKIAPTANWYPETIDHWGGIMAAAPHYKYFFTFDRLVIDILKKEGINNAYYLPFCADVTTDTSWPQEKSNPKYNIVFIGSYLPERSDREPILANVADYGLHIWGNKEWKETSLKDYYQGTISNDEMLEVYRSSRMVINHYITGLPGSGINLRPFEVTGAGALLINHDARSDIFEHFKDREEFVAFSGKDDIRDKVSYYMEHEQECRRVAKNGFLRTQKDHTYDIRVTSVLKTMGLL